MVLRGYGARLTLIADQPVDIVLESTVKAFW